MRSRILAVCLSLSLAASLSVPAFAAGDNEVYDEPGAVYSDLQVRVVDSGGSCEHESAYYVDNKDGTHDRVCSCGELLVNGERHIDLDNNGVCDCCNAVMNTACEHENTHYRDNKNGTHDKVCECGEVVEAGLEHEDSDGDNVCDFCEAEMDVPAPVLIATVPLNLPVVMDLSGDIVVSDSAVITNHQERGITVEQVSVSAASGWRRVSIDENFAVKPDNEKEFGISFRGDENSLTDGNWNIAGGESLKLNMAVNLPKRTAAMDSMTIARVGFVLGWSDDENVVTSDSSTGAGVQNEINARNKSLNAQYVNRALIFNDFVRFVQSDNDYYTYGKPSAIGVIEDLMAYYGLDYKTGSGISTSVHDANLASLRPFIMNQATKVQLQVMIDVTNGGSIPRT